MTETEFLQKISKFEPKFNEPLKNYTTWKIGGPAEILIESRSSIQLEEIVLLAISHQIPFTILGNGSNILISDNGLKGLVIINKSKNITILENSDFEQKNPIIPHRHDETENPNFYSFSDLEFEETGQRKLVRFDSGVLLSYGINWTIKNQFSGLQWFAGIPGTIGGSLYNNIHGGTRHFSEYFYQAKIINENGQVETVGYDFFNFGYDQSVLRDRPKIVILEVILNLFNSPENMEKAAFVAQEWNKRKKIQPKISCGSVFQCITKEEQNTLGYPTASIGYIVDKILNWKGKTNGGVQISPSHGNFIVNIGDGTAAQALELIKQIQSEVKNRLGILIKPEINFLGFKPEEIPKR